MKFNSSPMYMYNNKNKTAIRGKNGQKKKLVPPLNCLRA
jgi:hypothetical protein